MMDEPRYHDVNGVTYDDEKLVENVDLIERSWRAAFPHLATMYVGRVIEAEPLEDGRVEVAYLPNEDFDRFVLGYFPLAALVA